MKRRADRQGFALVAVIGVLTVIAALTGSTFLALRSSVESVALADEELALTGLARAGMSLTAYRLLLERQPAGALSGRSVPLPGGRFVASIRDEAGLVDLNGAKPDLLASVYRASGAYGLSPETFAARVVAWRDETKREEELEKERAGAAEAARDGTRPASGRPLRSLDEAASILRLNPRDTQALAPLVTVYNPDGKVNVLSASRAVLEALPGIARPTVEDILAQRRDAAPEDVATLKSSLGALGAAIKTEPGPAYRVVITARGQSARSKSVSAVIASANAELAPFHVLEWSE